MAVDGEIHDAASVAALLRASVLVVTVLWFADRHLCLPLWRSMDTETIDRVITAVEAAVPG